MLTMAAIKSFYLLAAALALPHTIRARGTGMPGNLTCNSKLLAYQFASILQPERDSGGMAAIAMGLGVDPSTNTCTGPAPGPSPGPGPSPPPRPPCPAGTCSALMPGMSLVFGSKVETWPKTVAADACEALCKADHKCTYGTWHDGAWYMLF